MEPGPASSVEERLLLNILQFKVPWFKTHHMPGLFSAVSKIDMQPRILEKCGRVTQPCLLETKKPVVTFSLSEREHSPI